MSDLKMSDVLQRLTADYGEAAPSYQTMLRRTTEGRVPAYRTRREWMFKATDMDAIRAGLKLPPLEAQPTA